jgi:NTP pyrophosphatase (non-canonical NTP hydrolase)
MRLNEARDLVGRFLQDRRTMLEDNQKPCRMVELLKSEADEACEAVGTGELAQELVDVIWFALAMAAMSGIDIESEFKDKAAYNTSRYVASEFQDGDYKEAYDRLKAEAKREWKSTFYQIP